MSRVDVEQFFAVDRELIAANVATGIDLYIRVAGRYVLYKSGSQLLDALALRKLMRLNVATLYVRQSQSRAFHAYMSDHTATLLRQAKTQGQQTIILRGAAEGALRTALQQLDNPRSYERVREVSHLTVERVVEDVEVMAGLVHFVGNNERQLTHALNVTAYAVALGARYGLDPRTLRSLGTGAMLHDIGMSAVDEEILTKGEHLTDVEQEFLSRHPRRGREILEAAAFDDPVVLDIVLDHHVADAKRRISIPAQIVQLADGFDALTNEVGERGPTGPFAALYHMRFRGEVHYAPELLRDFVLLLGSIPVLDTNSPIAPLSRRSGRRTRLAS